MLGEYVLSFFVRVEEIEEGPVPRDSANPRGPSVPGMRVRFRVIDAVGNELGQDECLFTRTAWDQRNAEQRRLEVLRFAREAFSYRAGPVLRPAAVDNFTSPGQRRAYERARSGR